VRAYNPLRDAVHYVTKYVIKDACDTADWRLISTAEDDSDQDLFQPSIKATGYQLFQRYMAEVRQKGSG